MRYMILIYGDERAGGDMSQEDQVLEMKKWNDYSAWLREKGWYLAGDALDETHSATTVREKDGKIVTTDGPFAETKEQIGGIMILESGDLNEAIRLMSNHPSTRMGGTWEIRPANEQINVLYQEKFPAFNETVSGKKR